MRQVAYSVNDVAQLIGMHSNSIRNMIRDGRLQRIPNTGRSIRIAATEVEAVFGVTLETEGAA